MTIIDTATWWHLGNYSKKNFNDKRCMKMLNWLLREIKKYT